MAIEGYCVKCKAKNKMNDPVMNKTTKSYMAKGKCPKCGTTMCRIFGEANALEAVKTGEAKKGF